MKSRLALLGPALALILGLAGAPAGAQAAGLARFVNPFAGTATARGAARPGGTFPGASMPFGMVQFGPDTTQTAEDAVATKIGLPKSAGGRGYGYGSHQITGFSLTHLNGAGCPAYGDFPLMPTTARFKNSPAEPGTNMLRRRYLASFSHRREGASPGSYRVRANTLGAGSVTADLTATTRSGFGRFTYPKTRRATMLINAGGSAADDSAASVKLFPGRHEVTGSATSGYFCAQRNRYRVYFAAKFDRGFRSYGTWRRNSLDAGSTASSDSVPPHPRHAARSGAYVTLNARRDRSVDVRVGISFVSVANARRNLRVESLGHGLQALRRRARGAWNQQLRVVDVSGAPKGRIRTLYTDLYQAELAPRTFNDVNGHYAGMDGQVHTAAGYTQYADFSGWDIYRSQIQLLALLHPGRASDMVRSLLADAQQSGCLPKWPIASGQTMEMIGDPADQIIASAAAFGARSFDHAQALAAMLKGAGASCRSPNNAAYLERQGLGPYRKRGFIPFERNEQRNIATSIYGSPGAVYGTASTTLEYAGADFAIAQFAARFAGNGGAYHSMMGRSANWKRLLNRHSRYLEPRKRDGSFPAGYTPTTGDGFAEGDSAQYSWGVPWNLAGLIGKLGGQGRARVRLGRFLHKLNLTHAGSHSPHAYLGNEPSILTPWIFDWLRKPYRTQEIVRRAITRLYSASPGGYPGQVDLGELPSWYVFAALGLYPATPGVGVLALDSPLFRHATLHLPSGNVTIDAPGAAPGHPYVHALRVNGKKRSKPWIPYCSLAHGGRLNFKLSGNPDRGWGAGRRDRPPSFTAGSKRPSSRCGP
jgi:predicted alpha-1,2-mannosidase